MVVRIMEPQAKLHTVIHLHSLLQYQSFHVQAVVTTNHYTAI